jgi:D-alanyl-lipoteichoic acid acyltransferase DltB (MBOAT superfamily)
MLLVSVLVNWQLALLLSRIRSKLLLTITIATDLAPLVYFKYLTFAFDAVGRNPADWIQADFIPAILPLGISFYTFQQIAYAVDIYKGQPPQRSFISTHSSSLSFHNSWPAPLSITPSCYLRSTRSQTAPLSCCGALFTF